MFRSHDHVPLLVLVVAVLDIVFFLLPIPPTKFPSSLPPLLLPLLLPLPVLLLLLPPHLLLSLLVPLPFRSEDRNCLPLPAPLLLPSTFLRLPSPTKRLPPPLLLLSLTLAPVLKVRNPETVPSTLGRFLAAEVEPSRTKPNLLALLAIFSAKVSASALLRFVLRASAVEKHTLRFIRQPSPAPCPLGRAF